MCCPAPTKVTQVKHHAALDWREAPRLWPHINAASGQSARAVAFLYLTAARSSEVRFAKFSEFDLEEGLWSLPGERMKNGKPHRVPLSDQAMEIIRRQAKTEANEWVFTNSKDQPLSDTALAKVLKSYPQKDHHPWVALNFSGLGRGVHLPSQRDHRNGACS